MPITLPPLVAPNELIESSWGNSVRAALNELDVETLAKAGGVMTGTLNMNSQLLIGVPTPTGASAAAPKSYVDTGDGLKVNKAGDTMTGALNGTSIAMSGSVLSGTDPNVVGNGSLIDNTGRLRATTSTGATLPLLRLWMAYAASVGAQFTQFRVFSTNDAAGSIALAAGPAVVYNTTSDERLKTVLRDVDDNEAGEVLRAIGPVVYRWARDPDAGEHIGFIAQQLAATWPTFVDAGIVTPGHGDPGDDDFVPWMVDTSRLVPLLVAGWQALDRRLAALEASVG